MRFRTKQIGEEILVTICASYHSAAVSSYESEAYSGIRFDLGNADNFYEALKNQRSFY